MASLDLVFLLFTFVLHIRSSLSTIVISPGACPKVAGQSSFNMAIYLGVWYEYQRFPAIFEAGLDCTTAVYGDAGERISVTNTGTLRVDFVGKKVVLKESAVDGFATVPDPTRPAELSVSFTGFNMGYNSPNYFIQDTDCSTYSVVYNCNDYTLFNIQNAWILTREPGARPSNLPTLEQNLSAAGVDVTNFQVIDQAGCPGR